MGTDALYHSHRKEHMTQEVQILKICQLKAEAGSLESVKNQTLMYEKKNQTLKYEKSRRRQIINLTRISKAK